MKKKILFAAAFAAFSFYGCQKDTLDPQQPGSASGIMQGEITGNGASGARIGMGGTHSNTNGRAGVIKAYYDSKLFNINFKEMPEKAAASIIAHNKSLNNIYIVSQPKEEMTNLIDVIDAVPGDGMNALWREVLIVFPPGVIPHQFYSDDEILKAASPPNAEIRLVPTDEVYRNSVIGPKDAQAAPTEQATGPELPD